MQTDLLGMCPCCQARAERAEVVAREWERQSKQWENVVRAGRSGVLLRAVAILWREYQAQGRMLAIVRAERDRYGEAIFRAAGDCERLHAERDEARARVAELEGAARAVVYGASHQAGSLVTLVNTDALATLTACVSSDKESQ